MRLFSCILLACIATILKAEEARPKRDLQFLKDVLAAKLGLTPPKPVLNEENIKIVQVPSAEQVILRAVPKMTFVEEAVPPRIVRVEPTINVVGSYLDTKTPEETVFALQGKQLLQSGAINARQEFIDLSQLKSPVYVLPPSAIQQRVNYPELDLSQLKSPVYVLPPSAIQQRVNYPEPKSVYPVFEQRLFRMPTPVVEQAPLLPTFPVFPPVFLPSPAKAIPAPPKIVVEEFGSVPMPSLVRVPFPPPVMSMPPSPEVSMPAPPKMIVEEFRSVPELPLVRVPFPSPVVSVPSPPVVSTAEVPSRYSYKQVNTDRLVTSYLSEGSQDVIITETAKHLPPPPTFIIDRLQKMVYGKPLGTAVLVEVVEKATPIFSEHLHPIITEPSKVDVKNNYSDKKNEEGPVTSTKLPENTFPPKVVAVDIPATALAIPPSPVIVEEQESEEPDAYKRVHADGTLNNYDGSKITKEPTDSDVSKLPKLPPPPQDLLPKKEPSTWGYTENMSNGVGSYETLHGGKINYSHLEIPPKIDVSVLPDPLSSLSDDSDRPGKNMIYYAYDQYGKPYISTKINGDRNFAPRPDLEKIKKIPPLPMPIADKNQKTFYSNIVEGGKYSYKVVNSADGTQPHDIKKQNDYHGFGTDGFSYTQVNHDGIVETFTGTEKQTRPAVVTTLGPIKEIPALHAPIGETKIPMFPTLVAEVRKPTAKPPPIVINVGEKHHSRFSYTQLNKEGSVTTISDDKTVNVPLVITNEVPLQPPTIVDVIQPLPKGPCKSHKNCKKQPLNFSYIQINNGDTVKMPAVYDAVEIPVEPEPVIELQPQSVKVEVSKNNPPEAAVFAKPVWSNYVYKQISHTNSHPITVVDVGQVPPISPVAEVHVKVNGHESANKQNCFKYTECKQVLKVVPDVPAPPLPTIKVIRTIPNDLLYIPPLHADAPFLSSNKAEAVSTTEFSTSRPTEVSTETHQHATNSNEPTTESQGEITSSADLVSFSNNPIVVGDLKYSYSQKQSDGSSLNVQGDNSNNVSVKIDDETKAADSARGDVPEAST